MIRHLYPLYRECLRLHGWFFCSGLVGLVAARVFGVTELGTAMYVLPFIVMFLILPIVSGNMSWVISLPLSKNAIMLQVLLLNFLNLLLCLANIAFLAGIHYLISNHAIEWPKDGSLYSDIYDSSPGDLAFWIFVLCFVFTLLFPHRAVIAVVAGQKKDAKRKWNWKLFTYMVVSAFVLPPAFAYRFINPMLFSAGLILFFPAFSMQNSMGVLGFSKKYRRLWVGSVLAVCLAGVLAVYAKATYRYGDPNPVVRYEAANFLGAFSGRFDSLSVYEDFLREDLPSDKLEHTAREYGYLQHRSIFFVRDNWLDQRESSLKFAELIKNKSSREALRAISDLFDPRFVTKSDLHAYLDAVGKFPEDGSREGVPGYFWVYVKLEKSEVLQLLESRYADKIRVALSYARFHPSKDLFQAILKLLPKEIPEDLIPAALQTLNTQSGIENTMREFAELSKGKVRGAFTEFECRSFDPDTAKDPVELNFCIRKLSLEKPYRALTLVEPYLFRVPLNTVHAKAVKDWKKIAVVK